MSGVKHSVSPGAGNSEGVILVVLYGGEFLSGFRECCFLMGYVDGCAAAVESFWVVCGFEAEGLEYVFNFSWLFRMVWTW